MTFDFPLILTCLTLFSGIVVLVDWLWQRAAYGNADRGKLPTLIEYCRSFFPIFFIVLILRSFLFQPFRVPTGSLEPSIMPGDFILVKQFAYGVKMPVWNNTLFGKSGPQRGDIALFSYPVNPKLTFVKRVIGLPGDHISYIDKVFYINGKQMKQTFVKNTVDVEPDGNIPVKEYTENLMGIKHHIIVNPSAPTNNFTNLVVPKGKYLMIGDNRDGSDDSRYWGFVPEKDFVGKALFVWMNVDTKGTWNVLKWHIGWNRIGTNLSLSKTPTTATTPTKKTKTTASS